MTTKENKPSDGAITVAKGAAQVAKADPAHWLAQPVGHADDMATIATYASKGLADISGAAFDGARVARIGMLMRLSAQKVPQLLSCTRLSLMWSVLDLARMRLEPDGEHAALVPYGKEAKAIPMYKGWIDIVAEESNALVNAFAVYRGEPFRVSLGTSMQVHHEMRLDVDRSDDNVIAAYSVFTIPGRGRSFDVMSREEIEKRKNVSKTAHRDDSPWKLWFAEKAKVTVIKRGAKLLPKVGDRFAAAVEADARADMADRHLSAELASREVLAMATGSASGAPVRGNAALKDAIQSDAPTDNGEELGQPAPKKNTRKPANDAPTEKQPDAVEPPPHKPASAVDGPAIMDSQRTKILDLCDRAGATKAEDRLRVVSTILGVQVSAIGALSVEEGDKVIAALEADRAKRAEGGAG